MLDRCYNKNDKKYKNYGGRGIKVTARWLGKEGFRNFAKDMGEKPKGMFESGVAYYTLDRKEVDKNYSKKNCRWATAEEQGINKTNTLETPNVYPKGNMFIVKLYRNKTYYRKSFSIKEQAIVYANHLRNTIKQQLAQ